MTIADETAELAQVAGITLAPEDLSLLRDGMRMGEDGRWASFEVTVPYSPDLLLARVLASMLLLDEQVLAVSRPALAGTLMFRRLKDVITSDGMMAVKQVSSANGYQWIKLVTGSKVQFTSLAGTGGSVADLIVIQGDPASNGKAREWLLPAAAGRPNPQIWYSVTG